MADIVGYQFSYETPTGVEGEPNIPTAFQIGGITDEVATGILAGLQLVVSITNVTAATITTDSTAFAGTEGSLKDIAAPAKE